MIYTDVSCMGVIQRLASLKKWLDKGNELGIHQIRKSWGCKKAHWLITSWQSSQLQKFTINWSVSPSTSQRVSQPVSHPFRPSVRYSVYRKLIRQLIKSSEPVCILSDKCCVSWLVQKSVKGYQPLLHVDYSSNIRTTIGNYRMRLNMITRIINL